MGGRLTLKRIVVDLRAEEMILRVLYTDQDGPNPGTKARARAVTKLTRAGLRDALEALGAGDVVICGTSGFTQREDLLSVALPRPDELREAAS
jgi:hypothetical protein